MEIHINIYNLQIYALRTGNHIVYVHSYSDICMLGISHSGIRKQIRGIPGT